MRFQKILKLINEFTRDDGTARNEEVVVGRKSYRGAMNDIAVELVRFKNEANLPFVRIYSKDDPNKTGYVPYKNFKDAMSAFDSITSMVKTVDYIRNYVNELDSYKWLNILKDEDIDAIKSKTGTEMAGMSPMGAPPGGDLGGGGGLGGLGGLEPMGGSPSPGGEAPGGETPGGMPEAGVAPTPEAGAVPAPEASTPAPAETTPPAA